MKLFGRISSCNVQKVAWALEELSLAYERIDAGGAFGGLDTPEFLALNPHGKIPVLVDGDVVVWESDAIVRYLAAKYGAGDLWPDHPDDRALADAWMAWTASRLYPDWIALFWKLVRTPVPAQDAVVIAERLTASLAAYAVLDRHLAGRDYVAGDHLTMADIPAGMTLYRWFEMDIERPAMPNVEAWYERLCARPAYRSSVCIAFDDLVGRQTY